MRIHHLNCATMRPPLAPQMVAHVLLLERPDGLVLVDTGLGTTDVERRHRRLGRGFMAAVRPVLDNRETAVEQVRALGAHYVSGTVDDCIKASDIIIECTGAPSIVHACITKPPDLASQAQAKGSKAATSTHQ